MLNSFQIKTDAARSVAVGSVMVGVLIGSLTLAYALTTVRQEPWALGGEANGPVKRVSVDDVEIAVPESFTLDTHTDLYHELDSQAVFIDPSTSNRKLLVGGIARSVPRAPLVALNQMLNSLVAESVRKSLQPWQPVLNFRVNNTTGALYAGLATGPNGDQIHMIGVLTEDGRRYWVIHLSHLVQQRALALDALEANRRLIGSVFQSADGQYLRDAQPTDFSTLGLSVADHDAIRELGLQTRIEMNSTPGLEPILLVPDDPQARVKLLRLRGEVDTGQSDPSQPLSPASLLSAIFKSTQGRPPTKNELWSGSVNGAEAWRCDYPDPVAGITRQVWYARLSPTRSVLIELLCEPHALARTAKLVHPLIAALQPNTIDQPSPIDSQSVKSAINRGRLITQWQRTRLAELTETELNYQLIEESKQVIGWQISQAMPWTKEDPSGLQGRTLAAMQLHQQDLLFNQNWKLGVNGSRYVIDTSWSLQNPINMRNTKRVEQARLKNGRLIQTRRLPKPEAQQWSQPVPDPFILPMAEEIWPINDQTAWQKDDALVWISQGTKPPQPYWIKWVQDESTRTADPMSQPQNLLLLRPLMNLDADQLTIDEQGRVIEYRSKRLTNSRSGDSFVVIKTDRQKLIDVFPRIETTLTRWEQDGASP